MRSNSLERQDWSEDMKSGLSVHRDRPVSQEITDRSPMLLNGPKRSSLAPPGGRDADTSFDRCDSSRSLSATTQDPCDVRTQSRYGRSLFADLRGALTSHNSNNVSRLSKLFGTMFLISILSCGLVYVNHQYLDYKLADTDVNDWVSFFSCFGVIYGIITGFLLNNVLKRFSALSEAIQNEVIAIQRGFDCVLYLLLTTSDSANGNKSDRHDTALNPTSCGAEILESFYSYACHLREQEWVQMSKFHKKSKMDPNYCRKVTRIYKSLRVLMERFADGTNGNDSKQGARNEANGKIGSGTNYKIYLTALRPIIVSVNDISKHRTNRIRLSNEDIPIRLKYLTILMSLLCMLGFILMRVENLYVNFFMSIAMSINFVWLFDTIIDMDHPFYGAWNIDDTCVSNLIQRFEMKVPYLKKKRLLMNFGPCYQQSTLNWTQTLSSVAMGAEEDEK